VYSLDRGTTEVLVERGIDARLIPRDASDRDPEWVAQVIQDHADVLDGLFAFVKGERQLSTSYIKELHAALLRHQEAAVVQDQFGQLMEVRLERGAYKKLPNNPRRPDGEIHEYCPPEHVASEMDNLIRMHHEHIAKDVPVEIEAAWLHHRFTQIHPFTDGNGRVARALGSLVFLKGGWSSIVISEPDKPRYIDALEVADSGNLQALTDLFVVVQRQAFVELLNVRDSLKPPDTIAGAIGAVEQLLEHRDAASYHRLQRAKKTAVQLSIRGAAILSTASAQLRKVARDYTAVDDIDARSQKMIVGKLGGPDTPPLSDISQPGINIRIPNPFAIVLSFHQLGRVFHGLIIAKLSTVHTSEVEAIGEIFQINHRESVEQARIRFEKWLEKNVARAILSWREVVERTL
jgi:Fic family protein